MIPDRKLKKYVTNSGIFSHMGVLKRPLINGSESPGIRFLA